MASRQDEFERVAVPHTRSLLRVARRLTAESARAEDLVQEAMLLAWRGFHQFRAGTNARAWLFRIMFNAHYAQGRKNRGGALVFAEMRDVVENPAAQERAEIAQALDSLAEEHRAVLMLSVVEGFTCREMAEILNIPLGTVMSRLSRARDALRTRLAPACSAKEAS